MKKKNRKPDYWQFTVTSDERLNEISRRLARVFLKEDKCSLRRFFKKFNNKQQKVPRIFKKPITRQRNRPDRGGGYEP